MILAGSSVRSRSALKFQSHFFCFASQTLGPHTMSISSITSIAKTILSMALSTADTGDNSLISIVGGDSNRIPSGKVILEAGAEGLLCRGGVFNVVRVDVAGIPNDADFSVFFESLLEDPVRTARYQNLIKSASESAKTMSLVSLTTNTDKQNYGHLPSTAKPVFSRMFVRWKN